MADGPLDGLPANCEPNRNMQNRCTSRARRLQSVGLNPLAHLPRRQVVLPADPRTETCRHDPCGADTICGRHRCRSTGLKKPVHGRRPGDVGAQVEGLSIQMSATGAAAEHVPVMLDEVVDLLSPALQPKPNGPTATNQPVLLDCTLGLGGHAAALLRQCPQARLIGLDRDGEALAVARSRLTPFADRIDLVRARFDETASVLAGLGVTTVAAALFDLGLSSLQIDRNDRGFAYATDAPLDMRMDSRQQLTAADILADYSQQDLARVLRTLGEERYAGRIASAIVAARRKDRIRTSMELVEIIDTALPARERHGSGGHPAKRTFQALRIEVNGELESLHQALPDVIHALGMNGRIAVLAYHSLEDRIVKHALGAAASDRAPRDLPVVPEGLQPELALLTRKPMRPDSNEQQTNRRARSARLRAATRIRSPEQIDDQEMPR